LILPSNHVTNFTQLLEPVLYLILNTNIHGANYSTIVQNCINSTRLMNFLKWPPNSYLPMNDDIPYHQSKTPDVLIPKCNDYLSTICNRVLPAKYKHNTWYHNGVSNIDIFFLYLFLKLQSVMTQQEMWVVGR
jgi:hypothetical protein